MIHVGASQERNHQIAFALGRHLGTAVRRNRLRRQLRSIVMATGLPAGLYLFRPNPSAMNMTFDQLSSTVQVLLSEIERER